MSSSNHAVNSDSIRIEDNAVRANQTENQFESDNQQLQLATSSKTLEIKPLEPRLKSFEAFIGRVTQITDELRHSIKRLTGRIDDSENRLDGLEPTSELLEYTSRELVTKVAELEATDMALDDRVRQAEAFQGQLDIRTGYLGDDVQALQRRSDQLETAAEQHDSAISALDSRLDYLEPKHQSLQISHDRLSLRTSRQNDQLDQLDDRLIKTSWIVGGVLLALTAAVATSYWYNPVADQGFNQQLTGVESQISEQATIIAASQAAIATMSASSIQLRSDNEGLSQQIRKIESRIYATEEDLSGAPVDLNTVSSAAWLKTQAATSYTIQLSGAYSKRAIANLIGKHNGAIETTEFAWFKTVHLGRDWFVLLNGNYASFDAALAEMEALPESLLKGGAYIRTFGGVQESLQRQ